MPIRRQLKNVVNNYSDAQVKVREATSNDPWGPSSSIMTEIADATYNVVAFSEIMTMVWKRLNDHGKNWRHVYKSLVLLEYIIKTGSERVAQQCRENIFAIQTLKDFQFIDRDGKDQGLNVREKAKQLVNLLKDEDRLKSERSRALKAKERFAQANSAISSNTPARRNSAGMRDSESSSELRTTVGDSTIPTSRSWEPERKVYGAEFSDLTPASEIEKCRPSNQNEEELQLQLALALSKQEAEEQRKQHEKDEEKVQMAIKESQGGAVAATTSSAWDTQAGSNPWGSQPVQSDPWAGNPVDSFGGMPVAALQADPWGDTPAAMPMSIPVSIPAPSGMPSAMPPVQPSPWSDNQLQTQPLGDPWGTSPPAVNTVSGPSLMGPTPAFTNGSDVFGDPSNDMNLFNQNTSFPVSTGNPTANLAVNDGMNQQQDLFNLDMMGQALPPAPKGNPDKFLGANSGLVNLDELVSTKPNSNNPFMVSPLTQPSQVPAAVNPFFQEKPLAPTLNQLRSPPTSMGVAPLVGGGDILLPAPLIPDSGNTAASTASNNPFL